jgi:hypothetical protein
MLAALITIQVIGCNTFMLDTLMLLQKAASAHGARHKATGGSLVPTSTAVNQTTAVKVVKLLVVGWYLLSGSSNLLPALHGGLANGTGCWIVHGLPHTAAA